MISALMCLALNIYFEAAVESIPGKWAVGQVVINRVESRRYPDTICKVIKQYKQFSWYWDGKSDKPDKKSKAWKDSYKVAEILIYNRYNDIHDFSEGASHYYNPNIASPNWQNSGKLTTVIGNHVFRRLKL